MGCRAAALAAERLAVEGHPRVACPRGRLGHHEPCASPGRDLGGEPPVVAGHRHGLRLPRSLTMRARDGATTASAAPSAGSTRQKRTPWCSPSRESPATESSVRMAGSVCSARRPTKPTPCAARAGPGFGPSGEPPCSKIRPTAVASAAVRGASLRGHGQAAGHVGHLAAEEAVVHLLPRRLQQEHAVGGVALGLVDRYRGARVGPRRQLVAHGAPRGPPGAGEHRRRDGSPQRPAAHGQPPAGRAAQRQPVRAEQRGSDQGQDVRQQADAGPRGDGLAGLGDPHGHGAEGDPGRGQREGQARDRQDGQRGGGGRSAGPRAAGRPRRPGRGGR